MQVVKKINNNVAICKDGDGRELIAVGRGIGFPKLPYELEDLSKIQRTFYHINKQYLSMIDAIPYHIIEITADIVDMAKGMLPYEFSPNMVLTLSDHIAFAIERKEKGVKVQMPLTYDFEQMYALELEVAARALDLMMKKAHIYLPHREVTGIAMAFVNARVY